jgi:hypothetical protein
MAANLTRLNHKISIQVQVVAVSCSVCNSSTRRPVRKRLGTPSYCEIFLSLRAMIFIIFTRSLKNVYKMTSHWWWLVTSCLGFFSERNKQNNLVYWVHTTIWIFNPMDKLYHLFPTCPHFCKNCNSSVGIGTRLRGGRSRLKSLIPGGVWEFFSSPHRPDRHWVSLTHTLTQWVLRALSLGLKRPDREANSHPPTAEFKECVELYLHSPIKTSMSGTNFSKNAQGNFVFTSLCMEVVKRK